MNADILALKGKRILVTGASSGIGRSTSQWLSTLGAEVVLCGRNQERLQQTHASLVHGSHSIAVHDLDDVDGIPEWLSGLADKVGPFDGFVHAAGIAGYMPVRFCRAKSVEDMFRINYLSGVLLAVAFRKNGVHRKPGSVVFLSSASALVGQPGISTYSATKAAIIAFVKCSAGELAGEDIRVNCVLPGHVRTPMADSVERLLSADQIEQLRSKHLLGFGEARDVAFSIGFLLSDAARWITGTALTVDGGFTSQR